MNKIKLYLTLKEQKELEAISKSNGISVEDIIKVAVKKFLKSKDRNFCSTSALMKSAQK